MSNRLRGRFPNRSSNRVPSWVLTAGSVPASLDIDFVNNQAFVSSPAAISDILSCTRGSGGYYLNADGTLTWFGSNTFRTGTNGLLVEEARTNLQIRSQEFDTADWTKSNAAVSANAVAAPDGTLTADKLTENSTSSTFFRAATAVGIAKAASAITYATSVYAKAAERTQIRLALTDGTDGALAYFNLSTGVVISSAGSGGSPFTSISATIEALASGWYRCILVCTSSTAVTLQMLVDIASGGTNVYTGVVGNGVYVWGAQLEAGSVATSYYPTTTASASRSADNVTAAVTSWVTNGSSTMYAEAVYPSSGYSYLLRLDDGTNAEYRTILASSNTKGRAISTTSSVSDVDIATTETLSAGVTYKVACAFAANDCAISMNGGAVATDAASTAPASFTRALIGQDWNGGTPTNSYIKRIAFWSSRISNANLQTLTSYALTDSIFDIDFVNSLAYTRSYLCQGTRSSVSISSLLTCTRGTGGYYTNSAGTLTWVASNTLRNGDLGLLVEEARTNSQKYSQQYDQASAWTLTNSALTANTVNAPDATLTAYKLKENSTSSTFFRCGTAFGITSAGASVAYTISVFAKAAERTQLRLGFNDGANGGAAIFNLSTGAVVSSGGTGASPFTSLSASTQQLANSWYRCILTATTSTTNPLLMTIDLASGGSNVYTGVVGNGAYIWGAQLEVGSAVSSYFPTTTVAAARSADLVTLASTSFFNGATDTIYASWVARNVNNAKIWALDAVNDVLLDEQTGMSARVSDAGGTFAITVATTAAAAATVKAVAAITSNDAAICMNGGTVATDATVTVAGALSASRLGCDLAGANYLNGLIKRTTYWPTRVGNTNLQTLTT